MRRSLLLGIFCVAIYACFGALADSSSAGTIIKLDLGNDSAQDVFFDGATLDTIDDGIFATTGDQQTSAEFLDVLDSEPAINTPPGSFTLAGLLPSGAPTVLGGVLVIQEFTDGTFDLYGPAIGGNTLLLSGKLAKSTLVGPHGPPATGALFTATFGMFTGGTLASKLDPNSLSLSMSLTDINSGGGLMVGGPAAPLLYPFHADVTLNIAGVPEPTSAILALMAVVVLAAAARRGRGY